MLQVSLLLRAKILLNPAMSCPALEVGIHRTSIDEMSDAELLLIANGADEQKLLPPVN
jgi:hypothetical protein